LRQSDDDDDDEEEGANEKKRQKMSDNMLKMANSQRAKSTVIINSPEVK
jgi:hypothetical protein